MSETLFFEKALQSFKTGDIANAKSMLNMVFLKNPYHLEAILIASFIANHEQNYPLAIEMLSNALEKAPEAAIFHKELALSLFNIGNYVEAIKSYENAISFYEPLKKQDKVNIHAMLAQAYMYERQNEKAVKHIEKALAIEPKNEIAKVSNARQLIDSGQNEKALQAICEILKVNPVTTNGIEEKPSFSPIEKTEKTVIATSIAPKKINAQREAVNTWEKTGFEIISVNTKEEIEILKPEFPQVNFVETRKTGKELYGIPLIFLDDVLNAIKDSGADTCMLVNSDIVLGDDFDPDEMILEHCKDSLVISSRVNLHEGKQLNRYRSGYDIFIFPTSMIEAFKGTELVLGGPWWDYWLPCAAALNNIKVKEPKKDIIYHRLHPTAWSQNLFSLTGESFIKAVSKNQSNILLFDVINSVAKYSSENFSFFNLAIFVCQMVISSTEEI